METLEQCPLCDNRHFEHHSIVRDHFLSGEEFTLVECPSCHLIFTNPRPKQTEIGVYYKSTDYISHSNKIKNITSIVYKLVRTYTLRKKYQLIQSLLGNRPEIHHLDYGSGTGHFIDYTTKKGWISKGYEPDKNALQHNNKTTRKLILHTLDSIQLNTYDVITLFHVLEHVHNLNKTIELLINQLKPNGVLLLALPNHKSFDAQHYNTHWAGYDVPRHLYHFNRKSVNSLAEQYGFKIDSVAPMPFDSYYVSMLSEKYLGNSMTLIRGLFSGLKSNKKARANGEYSSLIYILRK
ncbi:class I SAM-dependent methyltransferase [Roseivirga echinicomitans]